MTDRDRVGWPLIVLGGLFTVLVLGAAMWPQRGQYATPSFWVMAIITAMGAVSVFILLIAGGLEGWEALRELSHPEKEPEAPPPASDSSSPEQSAAPSTGNRHSRSRRFAHALRQVPQPPSTFWGRQQALSELTAAMAEGGAVIFGPSGVGKTALALKLADQLAPFYPDAQIFADPQSGSVSLTSARAMYQVVRALHTGTITPRSPAEQLGLCRWLLHDKRALLLLDDVADIEHLEPCVSPTSCALLITSQEPLELPGIQAFELGPLGDEAAQQLLHARAPRLDPGSAATIAELCGRLPLPLVLAGGTLATSGVPPRKYAGLLRDQLKRHDLLDASFKVSYHLLGATLQRRWAELSVFSVPFHREATAAVWDVEQDRAREPLERLVGYGLVERRETTGQYRLRNRARTLAYEKLEAMEDPRPLHRRAASYLERELQTARDLTPVEMIEMVDQWRQMEAWEKFARGTGMLMHSLRGRGYQDGIEARMERALVTFEERLDSPGTKSFLLQNLGVLAAERGDWQRAIERIQQSLRISERIGDVRGRITTQTNLAAVYADQGDWDRALEMYLNTVEAMERGGLTDGMARAYVRLGDVYASRGDTDQAIETYRKSIALFEREENQRGLAEAWSRLGGSYATMGAWDRAIDCYLTSQDASIAVNDVLRLSETWVHLGYAYAERKARDEAIDVYQRSLAVKRWLGDIRGLGAALLALGVLHGEKNEWEQARAYYQQALEIVDFTDDNQGKGLICARMGKMHLLQDDWEAAIELYRQGADAWKKAGDLQSQAGALSGLGLAYRGKGMDDKAIEVVKQYAQILDGIGDTHGVAIARANLADLYLRTGRIEDAKPELRRAYLTFAHLGSPLANDLARSLVEVCGSAEAANEYLAEIVEVRQVD